MSEYCDKNTYTGRDRASNRSSCQIGVSTLTFSKILIF